MASLDRQHYEETFLVVKRAVRAVREAWRDIDPGDIGGSIDKQVTPALTKEIAKAQADAASFAPRYVSSAVGGGTGELSVQPGAFAGYTTTGQPLEMLGDSALYNVLGWIGNGVSTTDALTRGLHRVSMYTKTEVADAGRTADQVQTTAEPSAYGFERVVQPGACDRCIVLAGKAYRYNADFDRHPNCDCTMRPIQDKYEVRTGPRDLFEQMSEDEQNKTFGHANAEAIREGADIPQVVNARQMQVAGTPWTQYGVTKRGLGGQRMRADFQKVPGKRYMVSKTPRPTAGAIMQRGAADGLSREKLVTVLQRYGYVL